MYVGQAILYFMDVHYTYFSSIRIRNKPIMKLFRERKVEDSNGHAKMNGKMNGHSTKQHVY